MKLFFIFIISLFINVTVFANSTIIKNVQGYTLHNNEIAQFSAIEFNNDKIVRTYQTSEALPQNATIIDGKGKTLLPGLIDAHGHVLGYGLSLQRVDLTKSTSENDAVKQAVEFSNKNSSVPWLLGRGWNQVNWPSKEFPNAKSLDEHFANKPVWFRRVDGHAGWANSKAMALAGITRDSISPDGGQIVKDRQGNPTGVFIDNAMMLIEANIPPLTVAETKITLVKALKVLAAHGLTSVHDAGIDQTTYTAYKELVVEQNMPIRVNAMISIEDPFWADIIKLGHYKSEDDKLLINSIKISSDGALGSRGAALIDDYSDMPNHKGLLLYSEPKLAAYIEQGMSAGFQVNTHAIGDNANKLVLDLYEKLINKTDSKARRHRIEHAQIMRLEDIPRFKQLGIIASMQTTHATSDKNMAQDRLGEERIHGAYAWRKLLNEGAIIASGSDFPIESANPFYGLHAAATRQDHENMPTSGWFPEERMTLAEALNSFTYAAAYSAHQEQLIGSLTAGKKADFILIDVNPFNIKPTDLWKIKVEQTWVNGELVYSNK